MIKYAIVGNIASGKSEAENILTDMGYKVLDTDKVAHKLLHTVNEDFKDYDVFENGEIAREKLGKLIFSNTDLKSKLEKKLHPLIREEIKLFFKNNSSEASAFVSIPLLFEANMTDLFDKIIFIFANDNIRLERLIKRNNYSKEYALIRMNSQMKQEEKIKKSDIIIYNNTTIEYLKKQLIKNLT